MKTNVREMVLDNYKIKMEEMDRVIKNVRRLTIDLEEYKMVLAEEPDNEEFIENVEKVEKRIVEYKTRLHQMVEGL